MAQLWKHLAANWLDALVLAGGVIRFLLGLECGGNVPNNLKNGCSFMADAGKDDIMIPRMCAYSHLSCSLAGGCL